MTPGERAAHAERINRQDKIVGRIGMALGAVVLVAGLTWGAHNGGSGCPSTGFGRFGASCAP